MCVFMQIRLKYVKPLLAGHSPLPAASFRTREVSVLPTKLKIYEKVNESCRRNIRLREVSLYRAVRKGYFG